MPISPTDLILRNDGSVYHLNLLPEHIADTIIAVGDPNRVAQVSKYFDRIDFSMNEREFVTHAGTYRGKRITVISTGIGTDNVEIFLTELDALANVDLEKREVKTEQRSLNIIRIGTSGALQPDIPVGTHLASEYGIGLDNLMLFYNLAQESFEGEVARELQAELNLSFAPYVVKCAAGLYDQLGFDMYKGNTITAPGFYAPQGRKVRLPIRFPRLLEDLTRFRGGSGEFRLTNFEMETASYYSLGRLLGHQMLSVNAIIANRARNEFSTDHTKVVEELIAKVLDRL